MPHDIDSLMLVPGLRCNYTCAHCCRSSSPKRREQMTPRIWDRILDLAITYDFHSMTISGGEPFLNPPDMWDYVFEVVRRANTEYFCVITNGAWTKDAAKRNWFLSEWLPRARAANFERDGLSVSMSVDQFHPEVTTVKRYWEYLMSEAEQGWVDGFEARDEDDEEEWSYSFEPLDSAKDIFHFHSAQMSWVQPVGRGKRIWWLKARPYGECCDISADGGEDEDGEPYYSHDIAIFPDGRVSGCCGGGGWVGNIMTMDMEAIMANHLRLRRENERRYPTAQGMVDADKGCRACVQTARRLFGTDFKEV